MTVLLGPVLADGVEVLRPKPSGSISEWQAEQNATVGAR
jgi:hypothetical protein